MRSLGTVIIQALDGVRTHRGRSLATIAAVMIATALAIAVPGLARSNQAGVAAVFANTTGRDVTWRGQPGNTLLPNDVDRLAALPGVGAYGASFSTSLVADTPWSGTDNVGVAAIHADLVTATRMTFPQGGMWTEAAEANRTPVALVSAGVAAQLGISGPGGQVLINGLSFAITGIFTEGVAVGLSGLVLIPYTTAIDEFPLAVTGLATATIATQPQNLEVLARVGTSALSPANPSAVRADYSTGARELASLVGANLDLGNYALTLVAALIAAALTAIFLNAAIRARRAEIGLRKALGARTGQIVGQFILEGAIVGCLGAGLGALIGALLVHLVATANHWPTVLGGRLVELTLAQTLVATSLAVLVPAWFAGRVDPIDALTAPGE